jgi:hypothetical protein
MVGLTHLNCFDPKQKRSGLPKRTAGIIPLAAICLCLAFGGAGYVCRGDTIENNSVPHLGRELPERGRCGFLRSSPAR